jgi:Icc-related predicted phosphoesterase
MRIAIASDLHLEFGDLDLRNTEGADILVLAGDILNANDLHEHPRPDVPYTPHEVTRLGTRQAAAHRFRGFLDRVSKEFPKVLVIAGNHELYDGKWVASLAHLRAEYAQYPNIQFMERDSHIIDGVVFVGGTLWTDANKFDPLTLHALTDMMADFSLIRDDSLGYTKLKPATMVQRFKQTLDYFQVVLDQNKDKKCVVISHHCPSDLSVARWFKSQFLMNGGFRSDLSEFILDRPQIKLWINGHTHWKNRYYLGDTLVACNPRGYLGGERSADDFKLKHVDLDNMPDQKTVDGDIEWGLS